MKRKPVQISEKVHKTIKEFCEKNGVSMRYYLETIINKDLADRKFIGKIKNKIGI